MKYRNATDIFPDELLREIQKYSAGELIYVPQAEERKQWGSNSGARSYYIERNAQIRKRYEQEGVKIGELAAEYGLSTDTIRKKPLSFWERGLNLRIFYLNYSSVKLVNLDNNDAHQYNLKEIYQRKIVLIQMKCGRGKC